MAFIISILHMLKDPPSSHEALKCSEIKNEMVNFL